MKILLIVVSLTTAVLPMPFEMNWLQWKQVHGKVYTEMDEIISRDTWFKNYLYVEKHNREHHSFKLGLNEYSDMVSKPINCSMLHICLLFKSHKEFQEVYLNKQSEYLQQERTTYIHQVGINITYPSSLDWRTKGFVSSVSPNLEHHIQHQLH